MLAEPRTTRTADSPPPVGEVRAHVRKAEHAARWLIARAAHMEKRAARPRIDAAERVSLDATARELRADAGALLSEIGELVRQMHTAERAGR
jgi:hypothetical protein